MPNNWCFSTVVLESTFESPLDCKEVTVVNPKGNQSWIFIGRADAKAEAPMLWPLYAKSRLMGKDPDAGKEKAGGKGDERGWDGWMASPTQRTRVWANSKRLWRTGKPTVLQFMGLQRVGHDWATEQRHVSDSTPYSSFSDLFHWAQNPPIPSAFLNVYYYYYYYVDHFKTLCWICCNIASALYFGFLAQRHMGS